MIGQAARARRPATNAALVSSSNEGMSMFDVRALHDSIVPYEATMAREIRHKLAISDAEPLLNIAERGKKTRMREHAPGEWDLHWDEIVRLYKAGERVPKIKGEMEKNGFKASKKQYHRIFKSWDMPFQIEREVKIKICLKERFRRAKGTISRYTYKGIPVPLESIHKWEKEIMPSRDDARRALAAGDCTSSIAMFGSEKVPHLERSTLDGEECRQPFETDLVDGALHHEAITLPEIRLPGDYQGDILEQSDHASAFIEASEDHHEIRLEPYHTSLSHILEERLPHLSQHLDLSSVDVDMEDPKIAYIDAIRAEMVATVEDVNSATSSPVIFPWRREHDLSIDFGMGLGDVDYIAGFEMFEVEHEE